MTSERITRYLEAYRVYRAKQAEANRADAATLDAWNLMQPEERDEALRLLSRQASAEGSR